MEIHQRNCPKCNTEITYTRIYDFENAEKKQSFCKKCVHGKRLKEQAIKSRRHDGEDVWVSKERAISYLKKIALYDCVSGYTYMFRKFGKLFSKRIKQYGGYKKLVEEAELNIKNMYKSRDGHILSSYYEWLFDEYLALNNIPHETEGFICKDSKCRYDFKINDVYVEIWGIDLAGSKFYNNYCKRREIKELIYKNLNLKLISIEGKDFQKSSEELQIYFKEKLLAYGIESSDKQIEYPIFNNRKIGYWTEETILKELKEIINEIGDFPTFNQLRKMKRDDLTSAIQYFGGYRKFAKLSNYEPKTKEFSEQYVIDELKLIKDKINHFPCDRELQEMERSDLAGMVKTHGGYGYFKELIEGKRDKKPFGYWNSEDNIVQELKILINRFGRFPLYDELGLIAKGVDKNGKGLRYFESII